MAFITFMSDFGNVDHYVAAVKARIFSINPLQQVVDISHNIEHFNLAHGSFVLKSVFRDYPPGTVHISAVNSFSQQGEPYIAIKLESHFFVGADNGMFSLISDIEPEAMVYLDDTDPRSSFPAKDVFASAAMLLAQDKPLSALGKPVEGGMKRLIGRQVRATKKQIAGHVVRVDHYGNLITNIEKNVFEILNKGSGFSVTFGRENMPKVMKSYDSSGDGDIFVIFNSLGLLEIGINKGNASELLGLGYDSPVNIIFHAD